ncbi:protein grindelwald [Planococcus citri]|uniref:protein grindelwald n=1 Tax=Planococcus citri TaxID=170843 RepID=UPI0031F8CD66
MEGVKIKNWKMALDLKTLAIFLVTLSALHLASAHSVFKTIKCGDTPCKIYEYCRSQDGSCHPCEDLCDAESHNHNAARCQKECSEFVHDVQIGYARKTDIQSLIDEVDRMYALLVVILILVVVLVTIVGAMLVKLLYQYRKRVNLRKLEQKKFQQKLTAVQYTIANNNPKRDDSINGTMTQSMRTTLPSTMTLTTQTEESPNCTNKSTSTTKTLPLSVEEPCEDTTLDYAAYVNQALSHSPANEGHLCPTKLDMS